MPDRWISDNGDVDNDRQTESPAAPGGATPEGAAPETSPHLSPPEAAARDADRRDSGSQHLASPHETHAQPQPSGGRSNPSERETAEHPVTQWHGAGSHHQGQQATAPLPVPRPVENPWAPLPAARPQEAQVRPQQNPYQPDPASPQQPGHGGPYGRTPAAQRPSFSAAPLPHGAVYPMPQPTAQRTARQPRRVAPLVVALLMLTSLLLGVAIGLGVGRFLDGATDIGLPSAAAGGGVVSRAPDSVAGIAAGVLPGVVYIEVSLGADRSSGSGFVIREDGYVLTNNHVVAVGADSPGSITVVFSDGAQATAEVVGRTADYDLAVLRVDRDGLTPLALGDSSTLQVGDPVVAVGAPLGLEGTVTAGIVSALNRPVSAGDASDTSFINAIQTDAAINPGNSGGPLVNLAGEVIGINSAIAQTSGSRAAGNIGLGFAIPSSQARRTAEQLISTGRATYPIIGVLLDNSYSGQGVQVSAQAQNGRPAVTPDGPAEAAGIRPGDVILRIDGVPVTDPDELIVAIRARAPGDAVTLSVLRDGTERDVEVTLGEVVSN
jgi:putative serine protease PepD